MLLGMALCKLICIAVEYSIQNVNHNNVNHSLSILQLKDILLQIEVNKIMLPALPNRQKYTILSTYKKPQCIICKL